MATCVQTEATFLPLTAPLSRAKAFDSPFQTSPSPPHAHILIQAPQAPEHLALPPSALPADADSSPMSDTYTASTYTAGAARALRLLNTIPDRFNDFCHMDQCTFVALADWILENAESSTAEEDISVEESLFVFLDVVARGTSFREAAYGWGHDVALTQNIFLNVLNALCVLYAKEAISPDCPSLASTKSRWRIVRSLTQSNNRKTQRSNIKKSTWGTWGAAIPDAGRIRVGDDDGGGCDGGISVDRHSLTDALTALNNFIHECKEF